MSFDWNSEIMDDLNKSLTSFGYKEDSSGIPKTVEELCEFIEQYYIHKRRVKEAYFLLKTSLGESFFDITQSPYAAVMKEFEEKSGLGGDD